MFCSRSVSVHLAKGFAAFALIGLGFYFGGRYPLILVPCIGGALLLFRGCPMCWMVGLAETIGKKATGSSQDKSLAEKPLQYAGGREVAEIPK